MKTKGFFTFFICSVAAIGTLSLVPGCKKPSDGIGSDIGVVDGNINATFLDTFTVKAITQRDDSVRADRTSLAPFGSYFDPYFGITTSSLYLNFTLNNIFSGGLNNVNQVDSVVLRVRYGSPTHFGDIGKYKGLIQVTAYRLLDKLTVYPSTGSNGYSSRKVFNVSSSPVGSGSIIANPYDSVAVQGVKEAPHIRLKLNNSFGTELLTADPLAFSSTQNFAEYFRGLFLKVSPATNFGNGGFLYLLPPATGSRLSVYYNDTSKLEFTVSPDNSVWVTHHEHNYAYAIPPFQNMTGSVAGDQTLLVQPLTGTKVKFYFPYIKNFNADKSVGINKAELVLPVDPAFLGTYAPPERLLLARKDPVTDSLFNLVDYVQSSGANGGTYDADKKEYKFGITYHLQAVLSGLTPNDTLVLETANKQTRGNRVAFYGTNNPLNRVKLRIYYTKLQ